MRPTVGLRPTRRQPVDPFRDFDQDGFFVFVPAIMSVGLVFSIATLILDAFRWTGSRARRRRTALEAHTIVDDLVAFGDEPDHIGLLPRWVYTTAAAIFAGGAIYVAIGSIANYVRSDGYLHDIAWLLALAVGLSIMLLYLAMVAGAVAATWPTPAGWTHRALRWAPLSTHPDRADVGPPIALTMAMIGSAVATLIVSLMVATGRSLAVSLDEPVSEWLINVGWIEHLSLFDPFGSTLVTVGFVALIGLSGFRCRVMAVIYPAAFVVSWLTVEVLQHTIDRARPSGYDGFESFPSGHMVQVVFVTGLLPPALGALLGSQRIRRVARTVLIVAAVATAVFRVHLAKHWPLDVIAGLGIGATVVLAAHWVLEHRGWHRGCPSCSWSKKPMPTAWDQGIVAMAPRTARSLGRFGSAAALIAAVGLGIATLTRGLPTDPEGTGFGSAISGPVQLALAAIVALAGLLALRWQAVAAFALAFAAVGLGVFAAFEYVPIIAFGLTVVLMIPAVLIWLSWQPFTTIGRIAALAVVTVSMLVGTGLGVREVHAYYFGPTHPESFATELVSEADWLWVGGVTDSTATVTAGGFAPFTTAYLQTWTASESPSLTTTMTSAEGTARFEIADLKQATAYDYRITTGDPDRALVADARFSTFSTGPQDLVIAFGSCARNESNGAVFDAIVAEEPDLYVALGDLHYGNVESTNPADHLAALARSIRQPAQASLFSGVPSVYVWDDHDYGPNDADRSSPARLAVSQAYRSAVPHYSVDANNDAPIAQAFTIGRIRFIVTDTRSQRTADSMLGRDQLRWFLDEVTRSSATHAAVVWLNPTPWVGNASNGGDNWASYAGERTAIANELADNAVVNLIMVSGDAHMVAIDDGSNSDYSDNGGGGFPILHAAALDRAGSIKGGPYSHGAFPGGGQYGLVTIEDDGGSTISLRLSGHRWNDEELVALSLTLTVPEFQSS